MSAEQEVTARTSLFSPRYFWTTIGANALVFLGAFEALAVTTVMPTISRDLEGQALYSVAFSGALAASVIGMVASGQWSDRRGPAVPLVAATAVFIAGLLVSGLATDMGVFLVGRLLQGFGAGAINVALYVIVARLYPAVLHPRIFGMFAAAWVLPSMIGPPIAGLIADTFSWHWVFLGVGGLVVLAGGAVVPTLFQLRSLPNGVGTHPDAGRRGWVAIVLSVVVAAAVLAISLGGEAGGSYSWVIAAAALAIVVVSVRPLLPRGALLVRRGLAATVVLRGAAAATFFATEVYLPYLLTEQYGLASWLAGLILTVGAVSWALGSALQSRIGERMEHAAILRLGSAVLVVGVAVQFLTAWLELSPVVAAAGWFVAGGGMGLIYPRISTLVLGHSSERDQGFNSAALSIADSVGGATSIAFAGLMFAVGLGLGLNPFASALALTAAIAVLAVPVAFRAR